MPFDGFLDCGDHVVGKANGFAGCFGDDGNLKVTHWQFTTQFLVKAGRRRIDGGRQCFALRCPAALISGLKLAGEYGKADGKTFLGLSYLKSVTLYALLLYDKHLTTVLLDKVCDIFRQKEGINYRIKPE